MFEEYVKKILTAQVYDVANETPIDLAPALSQRLNNQVLLKREDLQPVFSFKLRGAYNKIASLSEQDLAKGVIAASAGNHAQGVALAARYRSIKSTIVMPKTTPEIKVHSVKSLGSKVVLFGDNYDEACEHARELERKTGMVFVHPYDDPDVIAGQGTIAMEILRQHPGEIDAIFVPVGGGGLIAGMALYIKYLRPEIKVIGVEPEDAACLKAALERKRRVKLSQVGIFADGVAVAQIGKENFKIARHCVDEVLTANTDEICAAVKDIFEDTRSVCEPAGALALAGLKKYVAERGVTGQTLLAVESGANMNFDRLAYVAERTELGENREAILAVTIAEKPGSFKTFCQALGRRPITEFNYRYGSEQAAHIFVGVRLREGDDAGELVELLRKKGYDVTDMSHNEMAKLHVRHMVGGGARSDKQEVLYRLEFAERPGALLDFLSSLGQRWNISLFHYRNHGASHGRVLVGLQIEDKKEEMAVRKFIRERGYPFQEETGNPAYRLFLKG